jgi:excisionase family DNA binding protein
MPKLSEYVKVAEAAEILGVSLGTVRTWAADGKIPMHRNPANGYRLFKREDLKKFLARVAKPENQKNNDAQNRKPKNQPQKGTAIERLETDSTAI